jgi:hypothetical protein
MFKRGLTSIYDSLMGYTIEPTEHPHFKGIWGWSSSCGSCSLIEGFKEPIKVRFIGDPIDEYALSVHVGEDGLI